MFALIAALSATEAAMGTPAVDAAAAAAAPAVDWIGRWLPLFYVPSLVVLPLALQALPGALVAKASSRGALRVLPAHQQLTRMLIRSYCRFSACLLSAGLRRWCSRQ
jgi:hypothetical protein